MSPSASRPNDRLGPDEREEADLCCHGESVGEREQTDTDDDRQLESHCGVAGRVRSPLPSTGKVLMCVHMLFMPVENHTSPMTPEIEEETTVSARGGVTIPSLVRDQLGIEEGDKLRWHLDDDGDLQIEVVHQREGVFDDVEPIDMGETNAVDAKEEFGSE